MAIKKQSTTLRDRGNLSLTQQDQIRALLETGLSTKEVGETVKYKLEFLEGAVKKYKLDDPKAKSFTLSSKPKTKSVAPEADNKIKTAGAHTPPQVGTSLSNMLEKFQGEKAKIVAELQALIARVEAL